MSSAEIGEELANSPTIVASRFGMERHAEGTDRVVEEPEPEDIGAEGVARGSRGGLRKGTNVLGHGARILQVDVLGCDLTHTAS